MLDLTRLKDCVEVETVVVALGIKYKKKGSKYWLLCPFHDDKNIGSAFITSDGHFRCFSCNKSGDIFDVVIAANRCSFYEAVSFVASLFGGMEQFDLTDKNLYTFKKCRKYLLSKEELNALQIPRELNIKLLYAYDEKTFGEFIRNRSKVMTEKYNRILTNVCDRAGKKAYKLRKLFDENTSANIYAEMKAEVLKRICICQDIEKRFA